jgi:hypothetical protein
MSLWVGWEDRLFVLGNKRLTANSCGGNVRLSQGACATFLGGMRASPCGTWGSAKCLTTNFCEFIVLQSTFCAPKSELLPTKTPLLRAHAPPTFEDSAGNNSGIAGSFSGQNSSSFSSSSSTPLLHARRRARSRTRRSRRRDSLRQRVGCARARIEGVPLVTSGGALTYPRSRAAGRVLYGKPDKTTC